MTSVMIPLHMRFSDEDKYGHVNNVVMLRYFEDARVRLMAQPVQPDAHGNARSFRDVLGDTRTVVVHQSVDYHRQLFFRLEPLDVRTWVATIGRSSFTLGYRAEEPDGSTVYASGTSVLVLLDPDTHEATALTDAQRAALERFTADPHEPGAGAAA